MQRWAEDNQKPKMTNPGRQRRRGCQAENGMTNVALSLILDAVDDNYDLAVLLSADSDQAATARTFKERFPGKKLLAVSPPNRPVSDKVKPYAWKAFTLSFTLLERCVLPSEVHGKTGVIRRPDSYAPPEGWVHPDNRPTVKPPKPPRAWGKPFRTER